MPLMQIELHTINIADPSNDHAAPPVLDRCRNPFFFIRGRQREESHFDDALVALLANAGKIRCLDDYLKGLRKRGGILFIPNCMLPVLVISQLKKTAVHKHTN